MKAAPTLVEMLDARWGKYIEDLKACRQEFSEEAVHELRVSTRRLLALFELLGLISLRSSFEKIRHVLKPQLDGFDELRDTQVMLVEVSEVLADLPNIAPFLDFLKVREKRLLRAAVRQVKAHKPAAISKRLDSARKVLLERVEDEILFQDLLQAVDKTYTTVVQRYEWANAAQVASLHRLRIAFKQFRYMVEVVGPIIPDYPANNMEAMHNYQARLGDIQDVEVLLVALADFFEENVSSKPDAVRRNFQQRYGEVIQACLQDIHQVDSFWRLTPDSPFPWAAKRRKRVPAQSGQPAPKEQPELEGNLPEAQETTSSGKEELQ